MAALTQTPKAGDVVKYEAPFGFSRDKGTIAASQTVRVGSVLDGAVTALSVCTTGAAASAIALEAVTTGSGETAEIPVLVRHAVCAEEYVHFGSLNSGNVTAAKAALKALGVLIRTGPKYSNESE